jgi:hypothetical protein
MNQKPTISQADFQELLAQHHKLIGLANELEFHLYRLGEPTEPGPVSDCQQAAGTLLGLLRTVLFRHDQQVLPILEAAARANEGLFPRTP